MEPRTRDSDRALFLHLLELHRLTAEAAALLLSSSVHRIRSWMRTPGTKGANPVPWWAIELLVLKMLPDVDCELAVERVIANMQKARTPK